MQYFIISDSLNLMMSSPDMFIDDSELGHNYNNSSFELSSSAPIAGSVNLSSTPCLSSPVLEPSNQCDASTFSTPSDPPTPYVSFNVNHENLSVGWPSVYHEANVVHQVKVEFLNSNGESVAQTRFCDDVDTISIISDLVRANDDKYRKQAVSKLSSCDKYKNLLWARLLKNFSDEFSNAIISEECPLNSNETERKIEDTANLENIWSLCTSNHKNILSSLSMMCLGYSVEDLQSKKHLKQRLLSILAISAFSRNQTVNIVQKILGSYMKMNNTSKQGLQLLQRLGLTLVPKSIREDQDKIESSFLEDVMERKKEIELWHDRRKVLEVLTKQNGGKNLKSSVGPTQMTVKCINDEYVDEISDLVQYLSLSSSTQLVPDAYVLNLINVNGGEANALEAHLDLKPKMYDVTYDNLDISKTSCEYLVGQGDLSLHWTSSIVVEDVVDAKDLSDIKVERDDFTFEERIHLKSSEREHLLNYYVHHLMTVVSETWPSAFPMLHVERLEHQYTTEFDKEVRVWTGPLVCENESTLEGMSSIISKLTAELCPKTINSCGSQVPISVTTFSGDQKTEKAGRSAQLAMLDNGSMMDKLAFIEGRHEMLHFLFMFTDLILDVFGDSENLEEGCCLSRLIQFLNPKLEKKRGKDCFYAFRSVFTDIFLAQLSEYLCTYLNIDNLDSDVTPDIISLEQDESKRQSLFKSLFRDFVKTTHIEFSLCNDEREVFLPRFYPQERYLRHGKRPSEELHNIVSLPKIHDASSSQSYEETKECSDSKLEYFTGLFNILGVLQLLLDSIRDGNGLNCFLIQKMLLKLVHSSGHKNYACSMLASKNIILGHSNPQYSHKYMWNISCGRAGKGRKFPRDMKNEHHNRFLKDAFRSLGVNLNEKTATRVNNSADAGLKIEEAVQDFFAIDDGGKTHCYKDRSAQVRRLAQMIRREESTTFVPNRLFNGPRKHFQYV